MSTAARLFVVTGISASGKSTVSRRLAEQFDRGAYVEGDVIRAMVVAGDHAMGPTPSTEAFRQLRLRYRAAIDVAVRHVEAGFDTVVEDVVIGPELLGFLAMLPRGAVHLVVLHPDPAAVERRDKERDKTAYGHRWTVQDLHRTLVDATPRLGWWIDSTLLTPDETVELILSDLPRSAVTLPLG